MRYTIRESLLSVIGKIWMPYGAVCAQEYTLDDYDLANATDDETGTITRDSLEQWIMLHTGDFSGVDDWSASLEIGDETIEFMESLNC